MQVPGETGDCKGLTLSNLKPRPLRKPGLFFELRPRRTGMEKDGHEHNENSLPFFASIRRHPNRRVSRRPMATRWRSRYPVIRHFQERMAHGLFVPDVP